MPFLLLLLALASAETPELRARFIGNSGFEITDGRATLLVDFPYRSGAYGYMTFDSGELGARSDALCLFTHGHADHFDPETIGAIGCSVAGPAAVLAAVDESLRLGGGPPWRFGNAEIECRKTEHGDVDHCSWLIRWHERIVVISGDVEDLEGLLEVSGSLDVIVIPSWLASESRRVRARFPEAKVVISHHRAREEVSSCTDCLIPSQGDSLAW